MKLTGTPNINYLWSTLIIEEFLRHKIDTFCISPGSRSSPLTLAVARHPKAKSIVHFDERGSGFHALGIASATKSPVVLITTSGTAAANLFPAVIEASKKKLSLIVLTADRPPELRRAGAHQTIDQVNMFGSYARWQFDLPCPATDIAPEFVLTTIDQAIARSQGNPPGPIHLNCMFREPLAPSKTQKIPVSYMKNISSWRNNASPYTTYTLPSCSVGAADIKAIALKIKKSKSGIMVIGKLGSEADRKAALKLAEQLNWPVFPDISSGLRLGCGHKNNIAYFDQLLLSHKFQRRYKPDGVLHLGGRMTSKRWYDYIDRVSPQHYIMALNHPLRSDPLHCVTDRVQCPIAALCTSLAQQLPKRAKTPFLSIIQKANKNIHQAIEEYLVHHNEFTEIHAARFITQYIPAADNLFTASSMPIRELDMYGDPNHHQIVFGANRGASGIDGTIASAAGLATGRSKRTTLLIGDLAFLHDLNSLALVRDLKHPIIIVVLNNNGGAIFSFLPIHKIGKEFERFFAAPHHCTFGAAAELFGLNYARPESNEEFVKTYAAALKGRASTIIEIQSERAYNLEIHKALQAKVKRRIDSIL